MGPFTRRELFNRLCRRISTRYQFRVHAEISWLTRKFWGHVTDISREGMFIEFADPLPEGTRMAVRLALNRPLRLDCVVRRVVPGRGVGVTFSVGAKGKSRFEALLLVLRAAPAITGTVSPLMSNDSHRRKGRTELNPNLCAFEASRFPNGRNMGRSALAFDEGAPTMRLELG
jgi:hypothetical protein